MSEMWMAPSYNTRAWPYRNLPVVGDTVRYMNDGFDSRVEHIRWNRICMSDTTTFRRRLEPSRLLAWIVSHNSARKRTSFVAVVHTTDTPRVSTSRPLRPVTPYVQEVVLLA